MLDLEENISPSSDENIEVVDCSCETNALTAMKLASMVMDSTLTVYK